MLHDMLAQYCWALWAAQWAQWAALHGDMFWQTLLIWAVNGFFKTHQSRWQECT